MNGYNSSYKDRTGYFLFSLDTELAWGYFDHFHSQMFSIDGQRERRSIKRLLDIFDEFNIAATWAVVGHLFYEQCKDCEICPVLDWKGEYRSFEEVYRTNHPLWYGADVIEMIRSRGSGHEMAFHGYTHRQFDKLSKDEARFEIQEWMRLAKRKSIVPQTVIFPQGKIGHLDLFQEAGFVCYRGKEVMHPALSIPLLGKALNRINLALPILTPQGYEIKVDSNGLVNLPSSQWLFRADQRIDSILASLNLNNLRLEATVKGIKKAAEEKKVIHLWAHPFEFRTEKNFEKLRYLFSCVADEVNKGRLQSVTMANLAKQAIERCNP